MKKIRLSTFNVENLFARYIFRTNFNATVSNGFLRNDLAFSINNEESKKITAKAIREVNADVIGLQEVDNIRVLDKFISEHLGGMKYKYRILIDSFDPRNIDVALMSKYPIVHIRTYRSEKNDKNRPLFSRDCLEVDVNINGKILTVYVNHFKSMYVKCVSDGRSKTHDKRKEQANKVIEIVEKRWKQKEYAGNYAVLGDFNDYLDDKSSIKDLVSHKGLVNISERIPNDNWTHYWSKENKYSQLDFILLSPQLAKKNTNNPVIMRKGLPYRADKYKGKRFGYIGEDNPKASDHCPMYIDIELV